jgi:glycosyltransferase involved in cell wall biosynthesis
VKKLSVSIIIPVYNASKFVIETLESVLGQTYADWELILVDDGSADDSVELLQNFVRAHPLKARLFRHLHGENRGTSATRNLGLRHASGELVCFLDADDVWKPNFLEYFVDKFDRYPGIKECIAACAKHGDSFDRSSRYADPFHAVH